MIQINDAKISAFAIEDSLLKSPSQEIAAFRGIDRDKSYVPAVTLFLSEEVKWNFGKMNVGAKVIENK